MPDKVASRVGPALAAALPASPPPWYTQRHLLRLNFSIFSLMLLSAANGYDGTMMNGLQSLPQWQSFMGHPTGARLGLINAVLSLSTILAYPVVAWAANRFGRKPCLAVGLAFLAAGAALQTAAPNPAAFLAARALLGQPAAWFAGAAPVLVSEVAYPTQRAAATAFYACGWYVGGLVAAWATYGTRGCAGGGGWAWRVPSALQAAIPAAGLVGAALCPESPRWLVAAGRAAEARDVLVRYHGGGDERSPLVAFEMEEIEREVEREREARRASAWGDLVGTAGNRRRAAVSVSLGVFSQWCGTGVVSYYLSLVLNTVGITDVTRQTLINGFLQLWNLLATLAASFSIDRAGRRPLFLTSCIGMFISFSIVTGLTGSYTTNESAPVGTAIIPFLFLFYGFYSIAFTPLLWTYPAEFWPFHLRTHGVALTTIASYICVFFNTFVNPIAMENIGWKYYFVFLAILLVATVTIYFFYPETKGHSLEEMGLIFDDQEEEISGEKPQVASFGGYEGKAEDVTAVTKV